MKKESYERTIHVTATPQQALAALITGMSQRWTSDAGTFEKAGDVAKIGFSGRKGYWTFKARTVERTAWNWNVPRRCTFTRACPKRSSRSGWARAPSGRSGPETAVRTFISYMRV